MSKTEWFESWFDTSYYHTLYKTRDDNEAQRFISNLIDELNLPEGCKVLDLACGKGRHSKTLHSLGLDVLGVDLSENSIHSANEFAADGLRFGVQDMREPLDEKFDVVFNLFTSFGYFENISENDKVIAAINKMLNKEGILVIDFMNSTRIINSLVESEVKRIDNIDFNLNRRYDGTHIFKDISFDDQGRNHRYTERVQALKLDDFKKLLDAQGFEIQSIFGDFKLNPFEESSSDRLILIAKKVK